MNWINGNEFTGNPNAMLIFYLKNDNKISSFVADNPNNADIPPDDFKSWKVSRFDLTGRVQYAWGMFGLKPDSELDENDIEDLEKRLKKLKAKRRKKEANDEKENNICM